MVAISIVEADLERLYVDFRLTDLTPGDRYDVHRVKVIRSGEDPDTGAPVYDRDPQDRKALWSSVAHRVGWKPAGSTATIRDYDAPTTPFRYFVVRSALVGPAEHDWRVGSYPTSRGVLSAAVVDFGHLRTVADAAVGAAVRQRHEGEVVIRSTADLGRFVTVPVEDVDVKYRARGTEHAVLGRQYGYYVGDTREARSGSLTVLTRTPEEFADLRDIVFPEDGELRPVIFAGGRASLLLLEDMRAVPLDVSVEQAGYTNPHYRFVSLDFLEVDPTTPLVARSGDNDDLTTAPRAGFTVSTLTPVRGQTVTLTDTSTGQLDSWEWTIERAGGGSRNDLKRYTKGPHRIKWTTRGTFDVKLRVYGSGTGASTLTRRVRVR